MHTTRISFSSGPVVTVSLDERQKALVKATDHIWCDCETETPSDYRPDNGCDCGIGKHHYHCVSCGGVSQIG